MTIIHKLVATTDTLKEKLHQFSVYVMVNTRRDAEKNTSNRRLPKRPDQPGSRTRDPSPRSSKSRSS